MNEDRHFHSQCSHGDFLYVFFGQKVKKTGNVDTNSIKYVNATKVTNGKLFQSWSLIKLPEYILPQSSTIAAQINDTEIAILGD